MRISWVLCVLALNCTSEREAEATPAGSKSEDRSSKSRPHPAPLKMEASLGVADTGIFSDLDDEVQVLLPEELKSDSVQAVHFAKDSLLLVMDGDWPLKVYPTPNGSKVLRVGDTELPLRPGDANELAPLLTPRNLRVSPHSSAADLDKDGIPNTLDVLIGALKTVQNGANYGGGYRRIKYPGGDIPRKDGVCTDVVIRSVRNAGLDIQAELQRDIQKSPKSFPMVSKRNSNIDHRRVKTLLPYFKRQWETHTSELNDSNDPLRPGDIVFMDTFPKRAGPDHIGILSNRRGASGYLLVVNNWTHGHKTAEMDLLSFVPITHRFRLR